MNKSVKGSTLIEVLVAMTLIVTTVSFFFLSSGNIQKSFRTEVKVHALTQTQKILNDTVTGSGEYIFNYPAFSLKKKVSFLGNNPEILLITIQVITNDNKELFEMKKIMFVKAP